MTYRQGDYCSFHAEVPFDESDLKESTSIEAQAYKTIREWAKEDVNFDFNDMHAEGGYNMRDCVHWEKILRPRIHEKLDHAKRIIMILSSNTKPSKELEEEITYGMIELGLPLIAIYPEFETKSQIAGEHGVRGKLVDVWDQVPLLKENIVTVPTLHVPLDREVLYAALKDRNFMVTTKGKRNIYYFH